jgi:hypothetical protein
VSAARARARIAGVTAARRARRVRLGPLVGRRWCQAASTSNAGRGCCGLGDRSVGSGTTAGGFAGDQAQVGADRGAGEPVPVPDLDREPEPGQGGDPALHSSLATVTAHGGW